MREHPPTISACNNRCLQPMVRFVCDDRRHCLIQSCLMAFGAGRTGCALCGVMFLLQAVSLVLTALMQPADAALAAFRASVMFWLLR